MDYEKKYKEAQKWIESIYSELSHEQQMEAEAFFPELKEREDERIRKTLIRFFMDNYSNETEMYDGTVTVGKALAWLEKQGEQKQTRTDAFIEKACKGIEHLLSGYIIRNFHFGDSYEIDTLIEDFKKYMDE